MSKKRSKYIADFYYFDKILTVLSATSGGMSIISFACILGAPVGKASGSFNLKFSLTKEILEKLLKITKSKKKKHNKIFVLARCKLNCIETLVSQALIDLESSHEECKTNVNEEENYIRLKENRKVIKSFDGLNEEEDKRIESTRNIRKNLQN